MNDARTPVVRDLVLVGGGHSHVAVIKSFGMRPIPGVRLTVIARDVHTPYSGMLPGLIAGHYGFDDVHIDLGPLARFAGARLFHDTATCIDPTERLVQCAGRPPVPYDVLSINIGSAPRLTNVPGAREHAVPVKPIGRFVARFERLLERVLETGRAPRVAVVGGGAGGVEIAMSIEHRLRSELRGMQSSESGLRVEIFTSSETILPTLNARLRRKVESLLDAKDIPVHAGTRVARLEAGSLHVEGGRSVEFDEILWVTDAGAAPWIAESGLDVDERGFARVRATLQSTSDDDIFAAGDIASVEGYPREKAGVFAVRQGPPLAENLRRRLLGQPVRPFKPQSEFLVIISAGDKRAVAGRGKWAAGGSWVWRWKDRIDRAFLRKFSRLQPMAAAAAPALPAGLVSDERRSEIHSAAMRCGGCGAKVGATILSRVLDTIEPLTHGDVLLGLDSPDDAAVVRVDAGHAVVHTVDSFRSMVDDPWVFGKIAANHALSDLFAMGATATTALAIATLPYGVEAVVETTLRDLLQGANEVLREAGVALVGGHTSEGAELSLGFAVNGVIDEGAILRKGGLEVGDALILTKALGTGTLFAADMRLAAKGRWIQGALHSMLQSNQQAALCLAEYRASAVTDVTGFGLLGHLVEMTRASNRSAALEIDRLPILDGARETAAQGILSSLQPQNVRLRRALDDLDRAARHPLYPLLFDPQTSGGLLAGLRAERVPDCIARLRALGYEEATCIGRVTELDEDAPIRLEFGAE